MGVEHELTCKQCKEYIDLHKSYYFSDLMYAETPPPDAPNECTGIKTSLDSYWAGRGIWFLAKHRGHQGVVMNSDADDDWLVEQRAHYKEVFPYRDDIEIRSRNNKP